MKNLLNNGKVRNYIYFFLTILTYLSVSAILSKLFRGNFTMWFIIYSVVGLVGLTLEYLPILKGKKVVSTLELRSVTIVSIVIIIFSLVILSPDLIIKALLLPITGLN